MTFPDQNLSDAYRATVQNRSRENCPAAEVLVELAAGGTPKEALAEHLANCLPCASEFKSLRAVTPVQARRHTPRAMLALAALLTLTIGLGALAMVLLQRNRELQTQLARVPSRKAAVRIVEVPSPAPAQPRANVNVAVIDVFPKSAVMRGGAADSSSIPSEARSFTLLFHVGQDHSYSRYAMEITDSSRTVLWTSDELRPSAQGTFTIHFERAVLGEGAREVTLFGVDAAGRHRLETYELRLPAP